MIGFGKRLEEYTEVLDPRRRRRVLLRRAALAAGAMVLLVGALKLLESDESGGDTVAGGQFEPIVLGSLPGRSVSEQQSVEGPLPPSLLGRGSADPAVPAGEGGNEAGEGVGEPMVAGEPLPSAIAETVEASEGEAASDAASIGGASDSSEAASAELDSSMRPLEQASGASATSLADADVEQSSRAQPAARPAPAPVAQAPRTTAPARPTPRGFQVQIGGFLEPDAAAALLAEMTALGHPAQAQSRVTVGPYPERREADRALARLRGEQGQRGLIIQAPAGGGYSVQVGVFSDAGNASRLASRLATAGFPSQIQRRVLLGPYAERQHAETVGAELGDARAQAITVLALP